MEQQENSGTNRITCSTMNGLNFWHAPTIVLIYGTSVEGGLVPTVDEGGHYNTTDNYGVAGNS